jgi:hypothetical protein
MNGFALHLSSAGPARRAEWIAPLGEDVVSETRHMGVGDNLLLWGAASGDVHVSASESGSFLVLLGYVTEVEAGPELKSQSASAEYLRGELDRKESDEAIRDFVRKIHGSFGIVYRNQKRDSTIVIADRVGSRPIWRLWDGGGWLLSSHSNCVGLASETVTFAPAGLGAFLLYGGPIDPSKSLFCGIEGTPAGTFVRLQTSGRELPFQWFRFNHNGDYRLSRGNWCKLVIERLERAALRLVRSGEKTAIFFSGGTDSRLAAAALKSVGGDPLLVTLGDSANTEVRVASLAAKAMRLQHRIMIRDPGWYLRTLERSVYETGGSYVFTHGHFGSAAAKVRKELGVETFILGDLCEAFSKLFCGTNERAYPSGDDFVRDFDKLRLPLYQPTCRPLTLSLLKKEVRGDVEEKLRQDISQRYQEIRHLSTDFRVAGDMYFRWQNVGSLPTFFMFLDVRSRCAERNLMFDSDVLELFDQMPAELRNGTNFGASIISRMQPLAGLVMNSNSLLPMIFPPFAHRASKTVKPFFGKARRLILGSSHRTTGSWPEHAFLYLHDKHWRRVTESVLTNGDLFDKDFFDRDAVRNCWRDFCEGDAKRSGDVEKLLELGLLKTLFTVGASAFVGERGATVENTNGHRMACAGI